VNKEMKTDNLTCMYSTDDHSATHNAYARRIHLWQFLATMHSQHDTISLTRHNEATNAHALYTCSRNDRQRLMMHKRCRVKSPREHP